MDSPAVHLLLLFLAGLAAGTVNVIAGGGSFLTLPVLIFMGLPPTMANGTNRVGILLQNVGAVWAFRRHGVRGSLPWPWVILPACAGAVVGTWLALWISGEAFRRLLAVLMLLITVWTIWDPLGRFKPVRSFPLPLLAVGFFAVGIYGGFVQAGVGFLLLSVTTLAGLDLVQGNALKVACVLAFTVLSLAIFAWSGQVEWTAGLALAAGTVIGGQLGVRFTVVKGHRWVRWVVLVTLVAFAVRLWFGD